MQSMLKILIITLMLGTSSAKCQTILRDDLDGQDFAPSGHLFYKKNSEQASGTVRFRADQKYKGSPTLELGVKALCATHEENCSERAEVWEKPDAHVPYLQGAWYAFSVKFGDPIPQDDHRYVIAQWKREILSDAMADYSPLFAIRLNKGKLFATIETGEVPVMNAAPCKPTETPVWASKERGQTRAIVATQMDWMTPENDMFLACTGAIQIINRGHSLPSPESGWIDFVIYSKPGPKGGGQIEIIANGKWIATITGQIGHEGSGLGANQYFKFGPYRAAGKGEWRLYYSKFRRGPNCRDVSEKGCPD